MVVFLFKKFLYVEQMSRKDCHEFIPSSGTTYFAVIEMVFLTNKLWKPYSCFTYLLYIVVVQKVTVQAIIRVL